MLYCNQYMQQLFMHTTYHIFTVWQLSSQCLKPCQTPSIRDHEAIQKYWPVDFNSSRQELFYLTEGSFPKHHMSAKTELIYYLSVKEESRSSFEFYIPVMIMLLFGACIENVIDWKSITDFINLSVIYFHIWTEYHIFITKFILKVQF